MGIQQTATPSAESLSSRIANLEALVFKTQGGDCADKPKPVVTPFWECISMEGFAHTTGVDFSGDFTALSSRDEAFWARYNIPTGCGGFSDGRHTTDDPVSASYIISWTAKNSSTIKCVLSGTVTGTFTPGVVQIVLNGNFVQADCEYDSDMTTEVSLKVKKGPNRLVISYSNIPDTVTFKAVLWDESRGDAWIDPRPHKKYTR